MRRPRSIVVFDATLGGSISTRDLDSSFLADVFLSFRHSHQPLNTLARSDPGLWTAQSVDFLGDYNEPEVWRIFQERDAAATNGSTYISTADLIACIPIADMQHLREFCADSRDGFCGPRRIVSLREARKENVLRLDGPRTWTGWRGRNVVGYGFGPFFQASHAVCCADSAVFYEGSTSVNGTVQEEAVARVRHARTETQEAALEYV